MREIIFRGKREDNGEWVEGYYVCVSGVKHYILTGNPVIAPNNITIECYGVIPETVGQYTGLKDKNGVRIFEGDILKSRYTGEYSDDVAIEVVKWIYNGWYTQQRDYAPDVIDDVGIMPYSEVIGNVHDNRLEAFYGR